MKKNYKKPIADPVQVVPGLMLAASDGYDSYGDDMTVDPSSEFDSFFN